MAAETSPAGRRCRLGILFVHGIGEQKEGETLTDFGEPLIAWMRDWIAGHGQLAFGEPLRPAQLDYLASHGLKPDGIEVTRAALFPSRRLSTDPAHCVLDLRIRHEGVGNVQQRQRWLFAEGWWGEQVQPPSVFKLLLWLFSRGPFVAFTHTAERAWQFVHADTDAKAATGTAGRIRQKLDATGWRHLAWPVAFGRFFVSASALQLCLLLAWIVALIPLPGIRKYVIAALQRGTYILGDSYGLVANDTQRGAILTRLRHTVDWMRLQCDRLVIVAHSQGAGVVHAAIQERAIAAPSLLITFGAGLVKLVQLRQCEVHRRVRLAAAGWIAPTAGAAMLLLAWLKGAGEGGIGLNLLLGAFSMVILFCAAAVWYAWLETRVQTAAPDDVRFDGATRWLDLYASADPVPQGALTTHLPDRGIVSERIVNLRSAVSDHTSYWTNKTEFVSRLVAALDRESGGLLKIPDLKTSPRYREAIKHYRDSIFYLSTAWWLMLASVLGMAASRFDELAQLGQSLFTELQGGPLDKTLGYVKAPGLLIEWITQQLTGGDVPSFYPQLGHASVVVIGLLMIAYVCWTAMAALLKRWANALLNDFVGYRDNDDRFWGRYGALLVWPFILLVAMLPPLFAYGIYQRADPMTLIVRSAQWLLGSLLALFFVITVWQVIPKDGRALRRVLRKLRLALLKAIRPGSDHPLSTRRGWNSWAPLYRVVVFVWLAPLLLWMLPGMEQRLGGGSLLGLSLFVALAPLLLARLLRLVLQRGRPAWQAALLAAVPVALAVAATAWVAKLDPHFSNAGLLALLLSIPATGLFYYACDRYLSVCKSGHTVA